MSNFVMMSTRNAQTRKGCCFCLCGSSLLSLLLPNSQYGRAEIYADMIYKCYGIQMFVGNHDVPKNLCYICGSCVTRLRSAFSFRLQVEIAFESLQNELIDCKSSNQDSGSFDRINDVIEHSDNDSVDTDFTDGYENKICIPSEILKVEFSNTDTEINNTDTIDKLNIDDDETQSIIPTVNQIELKTTTSLENKNIFPKITHVKTIRRKVISQKETLQLNENDVKEEAISPKNEIVLSKTINAKRKRRKVIIPKESFQLNKNNVKEDVSSKNENALSKTVNDERKRRKVITRKESFQLNENDVKKAISPENEIAKTIKAKRKRKGKRLISHGELFQLDKNDVTCKFCNETFPWHNSLKRHMSIHFPKYICHVCGRFYPSIEHMKLHAKTHEMKKYIKTCEICNKTFKGSHYLWMHMRTHSDFKHLHKCPHCSERFTTYYMRAKHLMDVHNDEPNKFKCKLCPKQYLMSSALTAHVKKAHLLERKHKCQECDQQFFYPMELRRHMIKHSGIKNFQCEVCKKSYARRYTLQEHLKIHNNVKDYVCSICSKAFTQKCSLKNHMKMHDKPKDSNEN
ncbi:uncharacterized protein LOC143917796 [Arctopsyche grandis]|uniref:uncharacterized protein LOC143917796 n=1 Tax=Arctopsyche grandis TaxID=121162 RepID=UPI00406DA3C3